VKTKNTLKTEIEIASYGTLLATSDSESLGNSFYRESVVGKLIVG